MRVNVIIACGGVGSRADLGFNKVLAPLGSDTVIFQTVSQFLLTPSVTRIIIPASDSDTPLIMEALATLEGNDIIRYCIGGDTRTASIATALTHIEQDTDIISIHDGARPFVSRAIILDSIAVATANGSGITAYSAIDTIAIAENGNITSVPDRSQVYHIQTPQSFNASQIIKAYSQIEDSEVFTDDASVYARYIGAPTLSKGSLANRKITYSADLLSYHNCYIGAGYDTHRLVNGRRLILGGIDIPHDLGLLGHSDADVLTHAIMDGLFSACGERDIGEHFPDTDARYKGIASTELLVKCLDIIHNKGYEIQNISCVIMAEKPKLAKIIPAIITNLANLMRIPEHALTISATTTEGLGFIGREEGISARVTCICYKAKGEEND